MVKEWTVIEIDNLISLVKEHPCLYVQSLRENSNKDAVEKIWTSIAQKMGTSNRNVRRKWVSLMMKYEKNKEYPALTKNWPWVVCMNFVNIITNDSQNGLQETKIYSEPVESLIVCKKEKVAVEPEITVPSVSYNGEALTTNNVNANKLFLESLVEDLSSLSRKDQYDFKKKVLSLMKTYFNNPHN